MSTRNGQQGLDNGRGATPGARRSADPTRQQLEGISASILEHLHNAHASDMGSEDDSGASTLPSPSPTPPDSPIFGERIVSNDTNAGAFVETDIAGVEDAASPTANEERPPNMSPDISDDVWLESEVFPPTTVIGAPLGRNLSAIQAADALVQRWELIYQEALQHNGAEAPEGITRQLEQARARRAVLDQIEDRDSVEKAYRSTRLYRQTVVQQRVAELEGFLEEANEAERLNVRAAIACYRSGTVRPSGNFALFYAGHFVGLAPSYAAFTGDRQERLDRYSEVYGPGSFWFEAPLGGNESDPEPWQASALRGTWASEQDCPYGMGPYSVTMGFRVVEGLTSRDVGGSAEEEDEAVEGTGKQHGPQGLPDFELKSPGREHKMKPNKEARTVRFDMHLDSGATFPSLHGEDLQAVGIDTTKQAASSVKRVATANGTATWRTYELYVMLCDIGTGASLVDPDDAVWPDALHDLGGVTPVFLYPGSGPKKEATLPHVEAGAVGSTGLAGQFKHLVEAAFGESRRGRYRLSGLLPFKCSYMQFSPGSKIAWLGEDRRDVLGAQRMPGQRRWEPGTLNVFDPGHPTELWETLQTSNHGRPDLLRMAHEVRGGDGSRRLRVVDVEPEGSIGRSEISIMDDGGLRTVRVEPKAINQTQAEAGKRRRAVPGEEVADPNRPTANNGSKVNTETARAGPSETNGERPEKRAKRADPSTEP